MATANDLTRQQLDELDTLLQRMLKHPLEVAEPARKLEAQDGWRADPPSPPAVPHLAPPTMFAEVTPLAKAMSNLPFTPTPLTPVERPKPPAFVPPVEVPAVFGKLELAELTPVLSEEPAAAENASPPTLPMMAWPLFALNWMIEATLKLFGPPGEMLTRRAGKNLLGTAGVAMILGAGLWTAQGQGWIRLPLEQLRAR